MLAPFYEIVLFILFLLIAAGILALFFYIYTLLIEIADLLVIKIDRSLENHKQIVQKQKEQEVEEKRMGDIIENQFKNSRGKHSP